MLNALGQFLGDLRVVLRTTVPESFFRARLSVPWDYRPAQQDIGCVQNGPLTIDVPATWTALSQFHAGWEARLEAEAKELKSVSPDLVVSDISYLAVAAARAADVPLVCMGSLAWDEIMEAYAKPDNRTHQHILEQMRRCYRSADRIIRLTPAMPLRAFASHDDVGPIIERIEPKTALLRQTIRTPAEDRLVLVGFGGIALTSLPYKQMEEMRGYRFLVDGDLPGQYTRVHSIAGLGLPFMTVLASTDIIMTKPGYSTMVEAVDKRKPVVYVRRNNFGDEQTLVDYLHRYGRGAELPMEDFVSGNWTASLTAACAPPSEPTETPPAAGNSAAAHILLSYLSPPSA
ncbi:hypothetical protein YTPLAS18_16830 [Nitrospira sp.]|nr:hypothetical protein YTPLAS18_16830 [Nitrospira sp.]